MKKPYYSRIKTHLEKSYPVAIAFLSGLLAFFNFIYQFHDVIPGISAFIVAAGAFVLGLILTIVFTVLFYRRIRKTTIQQPDSGYNIIEIHEMCEFQDVTLQNAKYTRLEKIRINSKEDIPIYFKLPKLSPNGVIDNLKCHIENRIVDIHTTRSGTNEKTYFNLYRAEYEKILERKWEWHIYNAFSFVDSVSVVSPTSLDRCTLEVVFGTNHLILESNFLVSFWGGERPFRQGQADVHTNSRQTNIRKDFSEYLDGGIYELCLNWNLNNEDAHQIHQ